MNSFLETFSLARYLPPISTKVAVNWIASNSLRGKITLDPFGASPSLSIATAQSGIRSIVAANNPISRLLIEVAANPPTPEEAHTTLSTLAAARIRDERIEIHISDLYLTSCPSCLKNIPAKAFIWDRELNEIIARLIHCPHCGTSGEFPTTETDRQRASKYTSGGLHHARALERVASMNDPDRVHVEAALSVYPPRAVYALLTIVNKLDALNLTTDQERILGVLLLHAFDLGNTLWPYPIGRERPRQLTIPPLYRENNIWLALEDAANQCASSSHTVTVTHWPDLPPSDGGICLFDGRIKDLVEQLDEIEISAIMMAFPRPNQAYWSLSALWAGWLWGNTAVKHFKNVLRRRRFDWAWHTNAIHAALASLQPALPEYTSISGFVGEAEPGFMAATLIGTTLAGLQLDKIDLQADDRQAHIQWSLDQKQVLRAETEKELTEVIQGAARKYLLERGEPCNYLQLQTAILQQVVQDNQIPNLETPAECYHHVQQAIQNSLNYRQGFLRFGGSEKSLEVGQWWLTDTQKVSIPLADRVEIAVARYLIHNPNCLLADIENAVYQEFSGLLLPTKALIAECLESYSAEIEGRWQLRDVDSPSKRRDELVTMLKLITELGEKLGYGILYPDTDSNICIWIDLYKKPKYAFYLSASAVLGKFLVERDPTPAQGLIVIPGGRANLVMYKLQRDPRLQQIAEQSWRFVKYRQIRQLAESSILIPENLEDQLDLDPLTYSETQLRMF